MAARAMVSFKYRNKITAEKIEVICEAFQIGKLKSFSVKRRGISNRNGIALVKTLLGQYVLKFHPLSARDDIKREVVINQLLAINKFGVAQMLVSKQRSFFLDTGEDLVTGYKFIEGERLHKGVGSQEIRAIATRLSRLRAILGQYSVPLLMQDDFKQRIQHVEGLLRWCNYDKQKAAARVILDEAVRCYALHRSLFVPRLLHADLNPGNICLSRQRIYLLDLGAVKVDYDLMDLAKLIMYCFYLKMSLRSIEQLVKEYFVLNKIIAEKVLLLVVFVKFLLVEKNLSEKAMLENNKADHHFYHPASVERRYAFETERCSQLFVRLEKLILVL